MGVYSDDGTVNISGTVDGHAAVASATFTRPADTNQYTLGDVIANSTTAGSVTPLTLAVSRRADATGLLRRIRVRTSNALWANAVVRVHFFKTSPTTTAGDNVALSGAINGNTALHIGYSDVVLDLTFTDGAFGIGVPSAGAEITFEPATGTQNIFAVLEARGAYTPTSGQTFTVAVEVLQN